MTDQPTKEPDFATQLLGDSAAIRRLRAEISRIAPLSVPVLIYGETGTGKSHVARVIHEQSARKGGFIAADIGSFQESLIDSEFFGVVSGAFTGANARPGMLEKVSGGTFVLEAVENLPLSMQSRILHVLESGKVSRLGSLKEIEPNVRFIATSIADLGKLVERGEFRQDLFYRLHGYVVYLLSLRERPDDIPILVDHFLGKANRLYNASVKFDSAAIEKLCRYDFPGNIRELESIITEAVLSAPANRVSADALRLTPQSQRQREEAEESYKFDVQLLRDRYSLLEQSSIVASPIWQGRNFPAEDDYCFVLMPFSETDDLQKVYSKHVRPTLERCGLRCERADDIYDISGVMQSVWESVNRARLIVADLTGKNANVFYELGIAHTLGKPVIMLTQAIEYVPFDLRHLRCIVYEFKPGSIEIFEKSLEKTVRRVLSSRRSGPQLGLFQTLGKGDGV